MKNKDLIEKERNTFAQQMVEAAKNDSPEQMAQAFQAFAEGIQKTVLQEAEALRGVTDTTVLAQRGVRQLTNEESEYYQSVIGAMKANNPKQALSDVNVVLPKTVVDAVFDNLIGNHELLNFIDFQNTSAVTEWLMNTNGTELATWSPLCAEIVKELQGGFKKIDLTQKKLSAFLPVCKAMLDLGPVWLDSYVRTVLAEALAYGLEDGILNGTGLEMPIGMKKDLTSAIDQTTGYADKTAVKLADFTPESYAEILKLMAKDDGGKYRAISNVFLVVNPVDYLGKVFPATTPRATDGTYTHNVFPFPTTVIQSAVMEEGKAIIGMPNRYFMGLGTSKSGKIEYSDDYRFLEDERVYLVKLYGNGMPKDNNAHQLLDISEVKSTALKVEVVAQETVNP